MLTLLCPLHNFLLTHYLSLGQEVKQQGLKNARTNKRHSGEFAAEYSAMKITSTKDMRWGERAEQRMRVLIHEVT